MARVEPFFEFAGNYWWLVFPLFGLGAAVAGRLESASRRRHKQRLEVMRAKAELKAAQSGAVPLTPARGASRTAKSDDTSTSTQLEKLFAAHDDVTHRWLEYELDVSKMIAYPAMSDGRQPLTAAFLRAKRVADNLRPASTTAKTSPEQLAEYRSAVTDYEVAFDLAERDARRIRTSTFSAEERKRLEKAQQLLAVAVDQAATPAERQVAYKRAREELDGLVSISDEAIDTLEKKVALELTAGPDASASVPADGESASRAAPAEPGTSPATDASILAEPAEPPPPVPRTLPGTRPPGRVVHPKRLP
jgi:hypothetical protein